MPAILTEKIYEQETPRAKISLPNVALDKVQIELERTGCFGTCPSYHVIIRGNGHVTYKGSGFVDVTGVHHYQISQDEVVRLIESLRTKDIWSLRSSYSAQVTDLPSYRITVSMGDERHQVEDYAGESAGMPHAVSEYEDEIDRAARSGMWLHLSSEAVIHLEAEHFHFHSQEGATLLLLAVADDDAHDDEAILRLIELGAPVAGGKRSNHDWYGVRGPLLDEALRNHRKVVVDALIGKGALRTNGKLDQKKLDAAFRAAIVGGRLDLVQRIWAAGGDRQRPALTFKSVTDDDKPIRKTVPVSLLLTHSADQAGPWDGLKIAQWLTVRGCDLKSARADGDTLLHIAAEAGDVEFVRYLLAQGFDPSKPGQFKLPALGSAEDEDVALMLLEAGTDLSRMDDGGTQFRRYAEENHWKQVMTWLEMHGHK